MPLRHTQGVLISSVGRGAVCEGIDQPIQVLLNLCQLPLNAGSTFDVCVPALRQPCERLVVALLPASAGGWQPAPSSSRLSRRARRACCRPTLADTTA